MFRTGVVCGGWTLQAEQPHNNIVRVAYQAMAAVLGGVQSMFTAAWDEPFALPTEDSTTLALRTQQILAHETGVTRTVDPLGGSYFVESLTDAMEARIVEIMADLEARGGMVRCIEDGYVQRLIADESAAMQRKIDSGERVIVGVNRYAEASEEDVELQRIDPEAERRQLERTARVRAERDPAAAATALDQVRSVARGTDNLLPAMREALRVRCTVGEISEVLREEFGMYDSQRA
jgi:methylmalonyl-CoA mutase N-terminal domain/subunit